MSDDGLEHKLVAVLYADVAGYSRLTGEDELGTHQKLSSHLDLIENQISAHAGTVVHYAGDAVLAEFRTARKALSCAVAVQEALAEINGEIDEGQRVEFRIGVNLSDVIVDRGDIFGNGVNVAARLESLAEPGGICVSETVRAVVGRQVPVRFKDIGHQVVKNIEETVHAHQIIIGPELINSKNKDSRSRFRWAEFLISRLFAKTVFTAISLIIVGLFTWHQLRPAPELDSTPLNQQIAVTSKQATSLVNSFEPEMVSIPAGSFLIGSPEDETDRQPDERQRQVQVSAFRMSKFESTFEQYDVFAKSTVRSVPDDSGWGRGKQPVVFVSWRDATAYAEWLSRETGKRYRLPTEAEWEYAARANTTTAYHYGETINALQANFNRTLNRTSRVGSYAANSWGLHDMHGNAAEWTCSEYTENYEGAESICADTSSPKPRSLRGGAWFGSTRWQRAASRYSRPPDDAVYLVGFRLVQDD